MQRYHNKNWFLQKQVPTNEPLVEQTLNPIWRAGAGKLLHATAATTKHLLKLPHTCILVCMWVFCLFICVCTRCEPDTHRGQKKALDPLKLELGWLWATTWLQGIEPMCSSRAANTVNHWAISPVLRVTFCDKAVSLSIPVDWPFVACFGSNLVFYLCSTVPHYYTRSSIYNGVIAQ